MSEETLQPGTESRPTVSFSDGPEGETIISGPSIEKFLRDLRDTPLLLNLAINTLSPEQRKEYEEVIEELVGN